MIKIRRAAASEARPIIGLYAVSGCGKTMSALLLACGYVRGDMSRVAMIETESGRGEAYADDPVVGGYNVISLRENFGPKLYGECITAAEKSGAQVLIIDSASHEWEGVGGVLAMAAANQEAGKKGVLVWQRPKIEHAREFMLRLTQTPIPLVIVCMRARYPMYEVAERHVEKWIAAGKPGGDKARPKVGEWARAWTLEPKQSDDILFEMFVHGWIDEDHKLHVTKFTLDAEMREVFRDGEPITVDTGARLAHWATKNPAPRGRPDSSRSSESPAIESPRAAGPNYDDDESLISPDEVVALENLCQRAAIPLDAIYKRAGIERLAQMKRADYLPALALGPEAQQRAAMKQEWPEGYVLATRIRKGARHYRTRYYLGMRDGYARLGPKWKAPRFNYAYAQKVCALTGFVCFPDASKPPRAAAWPKVAPAPRQSFISLLDELA